MHPCMHASKPKPKPNQASGGSHTHNRTDRGKGVKLHSFHPKVNSMAYPWSVEAEFATDRDQELRLSTSDNHRLSRLILNGMFTCMLYSSSCLCFLACLPNNPPFHRKAECDVIFPFFRQMMVCSSRTFFPVIPFPLFS